MIHLSLKEKLFKPRAIHSYYHRIILRVHISGLNKRALAFSIFLSGELSIIVKGQLIPFQVLSKKRLLKQNISYHNSLINITLSNIKYNLIQLT